MNAIASPTPSSVPSATQPAPTRAPRVVTVATIAAALGAILLIVPEIWVAGGGLVWALAGLFHLAWTPTILIGAFVAVPVLWATLVVVRCSFEAETDPENASV